MEFPMAEHIVIQGRNLTESDIELIRNLMSEHSDWGRSRLSEELCYRWNWRNAKGRIKDMAARTLLLKLERRGLIELPPRKRRSTNHFRNRDLPPAAPPGTPIHVNLADLRPLRTSIAGPGSEDLRLFKSLLAGHHYLGHRNTVGENIRYLIRDRHDRPVACLLFGSAAWKCADRDDFIGWDRACRERNLQHVTNNTRFLVPQWVKVPHLASHVLGLVSRRIRGDWREKYGHPVDALETFVDTSRFKGTCYRAANWMCAGQTQGRTRNDRDRVIRAPVKDVWLYPLVPDFRERLRA
jgi:hypothetical protein